MKNPLNYPNPCVGLPKQRAGAGCELKNAWKFSKGNEDCLGENKADFITYLETPATAQLCFQPLLCLNFRHFSRAGGSFVWESIFGPFVTTKGQENKIARQTRPVENKHFPYSLDLFVNFLDQAKKFDIIQPLLCLNFRHFSRARGSFVWESIFGPFVTTKGQEKPTITYLTHPEKTSMLFKPKSKI
ncbi:MAG: hypothetical protein IH597_16140 [Bacteroidales bacterium]|nr:hypothetical protein [Bacteroidales bacterium]